MPRGLCEPIMAPMRTQGPAMRCRFRRVPTRRRFLQAAAAAASTQASIEPQTTALTGVGAFATAEPVLLPTSNGTAPNAPTNTGGSQSNGASPTTGGNNTAPGQTNTPGAASAVKLDGVLALAAAAFGIALF